jgi:hypothetical protein
VRDTFRVFAPDGPQDFRTLDEARACASALAAEEARALAQAAGAASVQLEFEEDENSVRNEIDGYVFFELRLTAVASGPPRQSVATPRPV